MTRDKPSSGERLRSEPRSLQSILQATNQLLIQDGFKKITIEAIAVRAGVSKVTIYRWWPNKTALVMHAFLTTMLPLVPLPDTGSVRDDLRRYMRDLIVAYQGPMGPVIAALIAEGQSDIELARAFRASYLKLRREPIKAILERGLRRDELRSDIDLDITIDSLCAPLDYRLLLGHAPLDEHFIYMLIDQVLNGLRSTTDAIT